MEQKSIQVDVAYATPEEQAWHSISVPTGSTTQDVIEVSGILNEFPEIDLNKNKVGIFGQITGLDHVVIEGDRVEIFRPIFIVPEQLERKKYRLRKLEPTIEKSDGLTRITDK